MPVRYVTMVVLSKYLRNARLRPILGRGAAVAIAGAAPCGATHGLHTVQLHGAEEEALGMDVVCVCVCVCARARERRVLHAA